MMLEPLHERPQFSIAEASSLQVVEIAPAFGLDDKVRTAVHESAVKLCKYLDYQNAGTVEFMVDKHGDYYFLEVNPRIQVRQGKCQARCAQNLQLLLARQCLECERDMIQPLPCPSHFADSLMVALCK